MYVEGPNKTSFHLLAIVDDSNINLEMPHYYILTSLRDDGYISRSVAGSYFNTHNFWHAK
jgi:hypothetical protein